MVKDSVDLLELLRKRGIEGDLLASARGLSGQTSFFVARRCKQRPFDGCPSPVIVLIS